MDILDKLKQGVKNFDINSAMSSIVATIGTMTTEGWVTLGYFLIAAITSIFTLIQSYKRNKIEDAFKQVELDLKKEELVERRIENNKKELDCVIETKEYNDDKK